MAGLFRAQDLTGGHSRTVQTLILVLARLPSMTLVPGVNADKWDLKPMTGTQESLWATGRSWRLMMPSGGYSLRQNHAWAFSNQNCMIVQEFYLCAIRLKCSGNHYITLLKITCVGFALNIMVIIQHILIMNCNLICILFLIQIKN